jgi:hypothetical protein
MVDYELKEILPNIFALKIEDGYQRAMLFMRSQEHYESAFPEIKGKHFDIFFFMEKYRKWKGVEYFSYPDDWAGFNVPGNIIESCTKHVLDARNGLFPTPYDYIMDSVISSIKSKIGPETKYYLLGVDNFDGRTMDHELAHGLYHVNDQYKISSYELVLDLPKKIFEGMESILLDMGYCDDVVCDEIQAYMSTGLSTDMSKIRGIKKETKIFTENLKKYLHPIHKKV